MPQDTSGFYKLDGELLYAPTSVLSASYELYRDQKDSYSYPVHGWTWFDDEAAARVAFGLPPVEAAAP